MNSEKDKSPRVLLFGTFDDLFLEALKELEIQFDLSGKASEDKNYDILVIGEDMAEMTVELVKKYQAVPIVKSGVKGFFDFNPLKESGNSFLYKKGSTWHMLQALLRACETFRFTYDWKVLLGEVKDFSKYFVKENSLIKRS